MVQEVRNTKIPNKSPIALGNRGVGMRMQIKGIIPIKMLNTTLLIMGIHSFAIIPIPIMEFPVARLDRADMALSGL